MTGGRADYLSYLLRLWRTGETEDAAWRASLESPSTGQRWGFGSLEDLHAFLKRQIGCSTQSPTGSVANRDGPGPSRRGDQTEEV
jgi:hypothetical protein